VPPYRLLRFRTSITPATLGTGPARRSPRKLTVPPTEVGT
jgi:hypothetical protein